jgi:hypothetical protein
MNELFQAHQEQPVLDRFIIKGWFKKTEIIKRYMDRGNIPNIPCYICNKIAIYEDIIYTRTLPKHLFVSSGGINICVVCNECAVGEIVVVAPKNLEMIKAQYAARSRIGIIDLVKEKQDLIKKREEINCDIEGLKLEINKLGIEQKKLVENLELEKAKTDILAQQENINKALYKQLIDDNDILKKKMMASFSECNQLILTTYTTLKSNYSDIFQQMETEKKKIDAIVNIEMPNNYQCNICFMNKISKVLEPCGHTICEKCIMTINEQEGLEVGVHCPFCKTLCPFTKHIFV